MRNTILRSKILNKKEGRQLSFQPLILLEGDLSTTPWFLLHRLKRYTYRNPKLKCTQSTMNWNNLCRLEIESYHLTYSGLLKQRKLWMTLLGLIDRACCLQHPICFKWIQLYRQSAGIHLDLKLHLLIYLPLQKSQLFRYHRPLSWALLLLIRKWATNKWSS